MPDDKNATEQGTDAIQSAASRAAKVAKNATDTIRAGAEQAHQNFQNKVVEPATRAAETFQASGQKVAESGSAVGVKMIDQAEQNAREAFNALREAASAKDLSDVMRIQGDYLREQSTRSLSQAREIGDLILQLGRDAVAPLRGSGQRDEVQG